MLFLILCNPKFAYTRYYNNLSTHIHYFIKQISYSKLYVCWLSRSNCVPTLFPWWCKNNTVDYDSFLLFVRYPRHPNGPGIGINYSLLVIWYVYYNVGVVSVTMPKFFADIFTKPLGVQRRQKKKPTEQFIDLCWVHQP